MPRQILDLSSLTWQMGRVQRQPYGSTPVDDRAQVAEWLPARVPGDVRADLIAAGRIPPVETPQGITAGAWVDRYDWWYRAALPEDLPAGHVAILEAEGIDYYSAIWLGDTLLSTHAGMFSRQTVTLPTQQAGGRELAIRVWGSGALPHNSRARRALGRILDLLNPGFEHFAERMHVPKAQFGFGWDFAPRLLSSGIWDDLRLVLVRGAYIEDLWAYGEPLAAEVDPAPVQWHLRLRMTRWQRSPIQAEITIVPENFAGSGYQTLYRTLELCSENAVPCTDVYEFDLDMAQARRWWPWDQGEPCLYRVVVRLRDQEGVLDEISQVAAARSVRREALPGGAPWRFVVNDRPLFLRGANWVPADILPGRVTPADYARLLGQAREANVNFLRVWGGGIREKQAFWDTCDRLGLMAWHEFPLACDFFDRYPAHQTYLRALEAEAEDTVRALRGHPSLLSWCGGNEINTEREAGALRVLAAKLAALDPTRPWIAASPSDGDLHQWNVWHGLAPWRTLAEVDAPFMSEFGLQAPPGPATLAEMFPEGLPASWRDRRWANRKAQTRKLAHYAGGPEQDPAAGLAMMQRAQAAALQVGLEACRLRRASCGGVAFWQFNEPWPAVSWSVIDRAGRQKPGYHAVQRSFQPLLIAARFSWRTYNPGDILAAELWVVNDGPVGWQECQLEVELDGQLICQAGGIEVPPASAGPAGKLEHLLSGRPQTLALRLRAPDNGPAALLTSNCYDLGVPLPGPQPLRARFDRWLAERLLKVG